ncbi:NAD-dependent succinate-semialdehyde dehydrogenase [Natronobiforma cellulositropha]|uniref:NAD-dependent succinate-semialdehyde dehydrogenase n=1 Tax=Natronobiforma cellulositropha TaxID=1679076 RepID=UPI0021D5C20F|nr:NAD-dependent succinate-semialdehyde dehydrogenase [Natronobiforma cellulositropha]
MSTIESTNPATGETNDTYDAHSSDDWDDRLERALETYPAWSSREIRERQQVLADAASRLRSDQEVYADLITREMGKPIAQSRAEVEKCAWVCDHYAEHAAAYLQDEVIGTEPGVEAFVSYEPVGPILAVMPWNFPFWQVFRFAAPTLALGNVGLLKHASNVPGCALAIEDLFREVGAPEGVFSTLLVSSSDISDIIADDRLRGVTLTGSDGAGRAVGEQAGSELKPAVLELGGSDPFVVLEDADLERTVERAVDARLINSGQSCIAAKRFIVCEDVRDEFVDRFVEEMTSRTVGDPSEEGTEIGPQARADLLEELHEQVEETVEAGATLECGGEPLEREGAFYPPTVLTDVPHDAPAAVDEVFGPAAAVFTVGDEDEAVALANDVRFGLGASVWTADSDRGCRVARRLEAGCAFVNELVKSDPRVPFGGVKDSGYGRELGRPGIRAFANEKTIWVDRTESGTSGESPAE